MNKDSTAADLVACLAVLVAVVSGSLNLHLWAESNRYRDIVQKQAAQIQTMERTLLMTK